MESVLKCATLHKNSPSFVPLSKVGLSGALKGSATFGGSYGNHKGISRWVFFLDS